MIHQLLIGSVVIAMTVAVQAEMYNLFWHRFETVITFCRHVLKRFANTGAIIIGVLYILLTHTVNVWIWASVFYALGAFDNFEPALYFTLTSFTTLGFGDLTLGPDWRLLGASRPPTASCPSAGRLPTWSNWCAAQPNRF